MTNFHSVRQKRNGNHTVYLHHSKPFWVTIFANIQIKNRCMCGYSKPVAFSHLGFLFCTTLLKSDSALPLCFLITLLSLCRGWMGSPVSALCRPLRLVSGIASVAPQACWPVSTCQVAWQPKFPFEVSREPLTSSSRPARLVIYKCNKGTMRPMLVAIVSP